MKFPTVTEWDALTVKTKREHAAWLLSEATRTANTDFEPLTMNEEHALRLVAEAFDLVALYRLRLEGLERWNGELRERLSEFYRPANL